MAAEKEWRAVRDGGGEAARLWSDFDRRAATVVADRDANYGRVRAAVRAERDRLARQRVAAAQARSDARLAAIAERGPSDLSEIRAAAGRLGAEARHRANA